MLDPLRSLAELVRTLTRSRTQARGGAGTTSAAGKDKTPLDRNSTPSSPDEVLRERLRIQIRAVGKGDPRRAREAFVATVLAAELGDTISLDSGFSEIVSKVARQLGDDAATNRDLAQLFDELSGDAR